MEITTYNDHGRLLPPQLLCLQTKNTAEDGAFVFIQSILSSALRSSFSGDGKGGISLSTLRRFLPPCTCWFLSAAGKYNLLKAGEVMV
jgi:hypothetical protein